MNQGAPPQKKGNTILRIVLIVVGVVVVIGVCLAVVAAYGMRKYIADAKGAEAKNALQFMAKDAVEAYEQNKRICPSATSSVPASLAQVKGTKYQSSAADWQKDGPAVGFGCIKFEMTAPQYFMYSYTATATGFTVTAQGDLNGDGVPSHFELQAKLVGDKLVVSPTMLEQNPQE